MSLAFAVLPSIGSGVFEMGDGNIKTQEQLINENTELHQKMVALKRFKGNNGSVQEQLRKQEEEFQTLLGRMLVAVWHITGLGTNKAAANVLGLAKEDIVGRYIVELRPHEKASKFIIDLKKTINSKKPKIGIVEECALSSGEKRLTQLDKTSCYGDNSDVLGMKSISNIGAKIYVKDR